MATMPFLMILSLFECGWKREYRRSCGQSTTGQPLVFCSGIYWDVKPSLTDKVHLAQYGDYDYDPSKISKWGSGYSGEEPDCQPR